MNRQQIALAVGIAVSALFLYLAVRDIDVGEVARVLRSANLLWVVPFVASLFAFCWCKALRWALLLRGTTTAGPSALLGPVIIGYMGTGLMPMQLGEVARAYLAAVRLRTRLAPILASLLVERLLDVVVLLLVLAGIGFAGGGLEPEYVASGLLLLLVAAVTCVVTWFYAAHTQRMVELVARGTAVLPEQWRSKLIEHLRAGAAGVQTVRQPSAVVRFVALSIVQWSFMCACAWFSLAAVGELVSPAAALAVLGTTVIAMTLPAGPGYVGTLQLAFVVALVPFDVARGTALAASIVYLVALWVPLVGGGAVLLRRTGVTLRDLRSRDLSEDMRPSA